MIVFGLTGNICCGKSTVAKTFRRNNIPVIDADIIARQVVDIGQPGYFQIIKTFGKEFLTEAGTINREKLGELVFAEKTALKKLNAITHQLIINESDNQIRRWELYLINNNLPVIVCYDAALIIENNRHKEFDKLVVVSCPENIQLERLMNRNNLSKDQAMARINSQLSTEEKIKKADYVIDTSKDIEYSALQTEGIIKHLKALL